MDKLKAKLRVFECLYKTQFRDFVRVTNGQIDELVSRTIEIANKLDKGE